MITGYNHNVNYKDDVFHVQTEDSGRSKAHIITHLYYGGNIVESRKISYQDILSATDLDAQVVSMMQKQHKTILKGLIKGSFDDKLAERTKGASFLNGPAPLNVDAGSQHSSSFGIGGGAAKPAESSVPVAEPTAPPAAQPLAPPPPVVPPAAAEIPHAVDPDQLGDGTFTMQDDLWGALLKAAPVMLAEDLEKALESDDDSALFGEDESERLDDMMLGFMKGL